MNEDKRRTGRTTRMLEAAVDCAKDGRAVYVVVAFQSHIASTNILLREMTGDYVGSDPLGIKVETAQMLGASFDWATARLRSAHTNVVVLLDHYAVESEIERNFSKAIFEMNRFDRVAPR